MKVVYKSWPTPERLAADYGLPIQIAYQLLALLDYAYADDIIQKLIILTEALMMLKSGTHWMNLIVHLNRVSMQNPIIWRPPPITPLQDVTNG